MYALCLEGVRECLGCLTECICRCVSVCALASRIRSRREAPQTAAEEDAQGEPKAHGSREDERGDEKRQKKQKAGRRGVGPGFSVCGLCARAGTDTAVYKHTNEPLVSFFFSRVYSDASTTAPMFRPFFQLLHCACPSIYR